MTNETILVGMDTDIATDINFDEHDFDYYLCRALDKAREEGRSEGYNGGMTAEKLCELSRNNSLRVKLKAVLNDMLFKNYVDDAKINDCIDKVFRDHEKLNKIKVTE